MKRNTLRKDLDFYLNLHYPVTIYADPDVGFVAEIEELPGCMTQAETLEEVFGAIEDARHGWIQVAYSNGQDIPLPRDLEEYSGKILIRIPKGLHRALACTARREGVSLNQYISSLLAGGVQGDVMKEKIDAVLSRLQLLAQPRIAVLFAKFGAKEEPRQFVEIEKLPRQELARR